MTSLGYRRGCEHNAARPGEQPPRSTTVIPVVLETSASTKESFSAVSVPKGFLALFLYSAMFAVPPILFEYVEYTWTDTATRVGVIVVAAVFALAVVLANDCLTWFNIMLFFHIGVEVRVLDVLMSKARLETTSDGDAALAWTGFIVVLVHLIPFLLVDSIKFLALVAFAGVVVNATVLVYLEPDLLLLVGISSVSLLQTTLCISGICEVKTSMFTAVRKAMNDEKWLTCSQYLM